MNPPPDMKTDLTTEERALAQRLARLGPHGEPSPALDARILAAAHDAVAQHAGMRRPRRRWPVAFGIAASLALAVGIAWQLRPLPQAAVYRSEAPVAASAQTTSQPAAVAASPTESATAPVDATAIAPQADAAASTSMPPPEADRESAKAMKSAAPAPPPPVGQSTAEPHVVHDDPAPASEAAAQSAPVAAPRAFTMQSPPPAAPVTDAKRQSAAEAADAAANALPETDTLDRLQATGTAEAAASDEPGTDVPPATMTSPEARDAWLARIRELLVAGKRDAARASLREFRHRYPDAPLPDDLRALGQ
jgi:hypothetical protein